MFCSQELWYIQNGGAEGLVKKSSLWIFLPGSAVLASPATFIFFGPTLLRVTIDVTKSRLGVIALRKAFYTRHVKNWEEWFFAVGWE